MLIRRICKSGHWRSNGKGDAAVVNGQLNVTLSLWPPPAAVEPTFAAPPASANNQHRESSTSPAHLLNAQCNALRHLIGLAEITI